MFTNVRNLIAAVAALGLVVAAVAKDVNVKVGTPKRAGTVRVTVAVPGMGSASWDVPITPPLTAQHKRDQIVAYLLANSGHNVAPVGADGFVMKNMANRVVVSMNTGNTGEEDSIITNAAFSGLTSFAGHFDPFEQPGLPAIFTAGIVTDVGTLSATVSAQELNFQTDGPIICQALFQRLAPRAPQYGAQINYAGDRLEVYFDPAYTVTQGGIIFGTSSMNSQQGASGSLDIGTSGELPCPGDVDGDRDVDQDDMDQVLFNFGQSVPPNTSGDLDGDGDVDQDDLDQVLFNFGMVCP